MDDTLHHHRFEQCDLNRLLAGFTRLVHLSFYSRAKLPRPSPADGGETEAFEAALAAGRRITKVFEIQLPKRPIALSSSTSRRWHPASAMSEKTARLWNAVHLHIEVLIFRKVVTYPKGIARRVGRYLKDRNSPRA